jgi:allantoicase
VVPRSSLTGNSRHLFRVSAPSRFTHVRLNIYPDGGVARLRVHGEAVPDPRLLDIRGLVDLGSLAHGGIVVGCSNMFYGTPNNLLLPGLARTMGEGWETARRRDDGNDWVMLRLGVPGTVRVVELDTSLFKGNAPGSASLIGFDAGAGSFELLPRTRLQPDTPHRFIVAPDAAKPATQVRLDIYPDGGMARLRLLGEPDRR